MPEHDTLPSNWPEIYIGAEQPPLGIPEGSIWIDTDDPSEPSDAERLGIAATYREAALRRRLGMPLNRHDRQRRRAFRIRIRSLRRMIGF